MAGKQPYIPLYIGDWEQDTNCLSIEAEGAWLKVVFKCWKNKGIFMTNRESLARLWKVDEKKFAAILLELETNKIADFEHRPDGGILIISRRLVKEFEIKEKRAIAGSKGGSKTASKSQAKVKQIPEYEYDNDIESENGKSKKEPDFSDKFFESAFALVMEGYKRNFPLIDVDREFQDFKMKVRNAPNSYRDHDTGGLRTAFQYQLKNAKPKINGKNKGNIGSDGIIERKSFGTL